MHNEGYVLAVSYLLYTIAQKASFLFKKILGGLDRHQVHRTVGVAPCIGHCMKINLISHIMALHGSAPCYTT